jgi:hypothetical protein
MSKKNNKSDHQQKRMAQYIKQVLFVSFIDGFLCAKTKMEKSYLT